MTERSLPQDLASLIHHVELSKAGWRERALELLVLAAVGEHEQGTSSDAICTAVNAILAGPLGRAQIQQILNTLLSLGRLIRLPSGDFKLSEATSQDFSDILQQATIRTANVTTHFDRIFGDLPPEMGLTWEVFHDTFLIPLVSELGAKTYHILTGDDVDIEDANSYVGFLNRLPSGNQAAVADRIARFVDPKSLPVREYVLRLLNTAFLVQAVTLSEGAMETLLARTRKRLRLRVFVDTNFLFSLIGLHENPADDVVGALHELISRMKSRVDVKLYMLPCTMDEATNTIASYQERLSGFHFSRSVVKALREGTITLTGITLRYIQDAQKAGRRLSSKEYFGPYLDNFIEIARSKGVELYNKSLDSLRTDQAVIDDVLGRQAFEKKNRPSNRQKPYELLLHDMMLWHFAKRNRPFRVDSPLDAESWVATIDFGLLGFDAYKRKHTPSAPPVCIHPTVLLQVLQLWVPSSDTLNAALMDSLRPMLPHTFDRDSERTTVRILSALSRFENADDLSVETVTNILISDAIRSRVAATEEVAEETEIVRTALAEQNKLLELRAKQLDQHSRGLQQEVDVRDDKIETLREKVDRLAAQADQDRTALEDEQAKRRAAELEGEEIGRRLKGIERVVSYTKSAMVGIATGTLAGVVAWVGGTQVMVATVPLEYALVLGGFGVLSAGFGSARAYIVLRSPELRERPGTKITSWVAKGTGTLFGGLLIGFLVEFFLSMYGDN